MSHECIIGQISEYEDTRLVTVKALKQHINTRIQIAELLHGPKVSFLTDRGADGQRLYSLADYCDRRRQTDLERFTYCPICGEIISWKDIREGKA